MNIVIDQGNTSSKVAFFHRNKLRASFIFKPLTEKRLVKLLNEFSPSMGILCSVSEKNPEMKTLLEERLPFFVELDNCDNLPIKVEYKTPQTLGKDRIAAAVGAQLQYPNRDILIIDAGTAITYDFVDAYGTFRGGNISPGMTMRFKALNKFTKRLPLLDEIGDLPTLGYDTETAIRSGVITGVIHEMDTYINFFKEKHPGLLVFLTGGHSFYFEKKLKNTTFVDGNLVLTGLNNVLNYQNEN